MWRNLLRRSFWILLCFHVVSGGVVCAEGRVFLATRANFNSQEIERIPQNIMKAAADQGWQMVPTGLQKREAIGSSTVLPSSQQLPKGRYDVIAIIDDKRRPIAVLYKDEEVDIRFLTLASREGPAETIDVDIIWVRFGPRAIEHHIPDVHLQESAAYKCLDYNGWLGDQKHYPHYGPKAWINFLGSDCNLAYMQAACWRDNSPHAFCNGKGSCSLKINHSPKYHRHTGPLQ